MVFGNIIIPFGAMTVVENGFKSGNDRLVAGSTVKGIGELVFRREERV